MSAKYRGGLICRIFLLAALALVPVGCGEQKPKPVVGFTEIREPDRSPGPGNKFSCVVFSPDGKYLLLGYNVSRGVGRSRQDVTFPFLRLLDAASGKEVRAYPQDRD